MKIGLLSPVLSHNYGTVLQAFALNKVINEMGPESEYITVGLYKNHKSMIKFVIGHPLFILRQLYIKLKNRGALKYDFLNGDRYFLIKKKNEEFINEFISLSPEIYSSEDFAQLNELYSLFIVGSDQTWSPEINYWYSPFFLSFVKSDSKKVSYACSFGTNQLNKSYLRYVKRKLCSFRYLSCRDKSNSEMLTGLLNREVHNVLDPTLLIDFNCWKSYMKEVDVPNEYILCYILGKKNCISRYAEMVSSHTKMPILYIVTRPEYEDRKFSLYNIGCQEFLFLVSHCSYMITDSFHGTIFSLNFHRNVESFNKYEFSMFDNGRIFEILSEVGLENHFHDDTNFSMPTAIDYEVVDRILAKKRAQSIEYLLRSLDVDENKIL